MPDPKKGFECYCDADFLEIGTGNLHPWVPVPPSHEADGSFLLRILHLMVLQTSISNCAVHFWGWVHHHVTGTTWSHSHHELSTENEGAELQGHLYQTLCLLQGIWRQCRSPGTCKASKAKAMPKDQSYTYLLSSLLQTRATGANQELPHQHQRSDCWCTHESSGTKWLPASLLPYVWCVTSLSPQSEGVLCNWEYSGTYLGYLPMIPTSPQCDTFQLIPVSFLEFLRTFHLIIYSGSSMI